MTLTLISERVKHILTYVVVVERSPSYMSHGPQSHWDQGQAGTHVFNDGGNAMTGIANFFEIEIAIIFRSLLLIKELAALGKDLHYQETQMRCY